MDALKFNLDQDNRPLKETINLASLENSPFKEQYLNALSEIESYLCTIQDKSTDRDMDFANNILLLQEIEVLVRLLVWLL